MQTSMVRDTMKASEGESGLYSPVSFANMWWQTECWLITQKETECIEWREVVPRQNPGGPNKPEVKERSLFHLQLLRVSYLVGKNAKKIEQDREYRRCFRGKSDGFYDRWCRMQRFDPEELEWRKSRNLKQSGGFYNPQQHACREPMAQTHESVSSFISLWLE